MLEMIELYAYSSEFLSMCQRSKAGFGSMPLGRDLREVSFVPRLSIIIAHRGDVAALEKSILSVLENRPTGTEIIVAHNGSYPDPYSLGDELTLLEVDTTNPVALANAGLRFSRSPVVYLLAEGASVSGDRWADDSLAKMAGDISLVALAPGLDRVNWQTYDHLPGGFYRKHVLQALGGWNEHVAWENAAYELALLLNQFNVRYECLKNRVVSETEDVGRNCSAKSIKQRAELAVAYDLSSGGVVSASLALLGSLLRGRMRSGVAWAGGLLGSSTIDRVVRQRVRSASLGLRQSTDGPQTIPFEPAKSSRRAA